MKIKKLSIVAAAILALSSQAILAQDNQAKDSADNSGAVNITLQPYIWVPTLNGSASLGPIVAPVHVTPKDFADGFQIGGMGRLKIEHDNNFVYLDTIIVDYDSSSFRPFFEQPLLAKVRYFDFGIGTTKKIKLGKKASTTISPQIGVQHLYLLADVDGSLIAARAPGKWWSPSAGVTANIPLVKNLSVDLAAHAAGFGLDRSNYQNAEATLKYRIGKKWEISAGYRATKGRFDSTKGLSVDLDGGGPMVAISYKFKLAD